MLTTATSPTSTSIWSASRNVRTSTRTLVLNDAPADFQPDTHVALGPWCFHKVEQSYPEWEKLPFVSPFRSRAERVAGGEACRALGNALVQRIAAEMNCQYSVQHGRAYWHVVLMNWVMHVVMISWRLWCHVEAFRALAGSEEMQVPLPSSEFPRLDDTGQLVVACYDSSDFRGWLLGHIVRQLAPPNWTLLETGKPNSFAPRGSQTSRERNGRVRRVSGMRWWHEFALSALVRIAPKRRARFGPLLAGGIDGFPAAFLELLDRLILDTRPNNLGDGFAKLAADAARQNGRPGQLDVSFVNPHCDRENIAHAQATEAGERVVNVQHGGSFLGAQPLAPELYYCYDTNITWGWTEHPPYNGRFLPLPHPCLRLLERSRKKPESDIVLVGTIMPAFTPRFDFTADTLEYRRWKARFIASLDAEVRRSLVYRPYPTSYSFDDFEWLSQRFEGLREWHGENFTAAIPNLRLAILDHLSTTFGFAMAANVPTIGFWDQSDWLMSAGPWEKFKPLERVGILFDTPEKAAAQVNTILPDIEAWWLDPERQRVRKEWCRTFAWSDRWWFWRWAKALATL